MIPISRLPHAEAGAVIRISLDLNAEPSHETSIMPEGNAERSDETWITRRPKASRFRAIRIG